MKLHTFSVKHPIRLLVAAALLPLAANAGTLHHVESSRLVPPAASDTKIASLANSDALAKQQRLKASLMISMRQHVEEVSHQASLLHNLYRQLNRDMARGDEEAIAATQAQYAAHRKAFLKAQQDLRATLFELRQTKNVEETQIN